MADKLSAPQPLTANHLIRQFDCGEQTLNDWLLKRALANQQHGASRTFVVVNEQGVVVAYYALAAGAVALRDAPGKIKRNMPNPIPVMILGRLAVDANYKGLKIGAGLLQDAVKRAHLVSQHTGVRALLVHALNQGAMTFYKKYGFESSPTDLMMLMLRLKMMSGDAAVTNLA